MPLYDIRNGTLARRNAEARVARHNAVKAVRALPAPVRAQKLADLVQLLSDADLVGVLSGGVNLEAVLRRSLCDRGLDLNGQWIGFAEAERAFDAWYDAGRRAAGACQSTGL